MLLSSTLLSLLLLAPADEGCASSRAALASNAAQKNIVETALAAGSFKTLAAALTAGELVDALQGDGPFTVFAPTDEAFAKLPADQLAFLLKPANKPLLQAILTYHVVSGRVPAKAVIKQKFATSLNGQRIDFKVSDAGVTVDGASVLKTDIACSNGIIHVIDSVLLPSTTDIVGTAVEAGSFKTLAAALKAAKLIEALRGDGPFTVFAPTDEAFAALPQGTVEKLLKPENRATLAAILKFHVVPGRVYADTVAAGHEFKTLEGRSFTTRTVKTRNMPDKVMVNGASVLKADIETSNGVIHVIDSVLLPE
jgi:transforming growth factor-beta-induced protein